MIKKTSTGKWGLYSKSTGQLLGEHDSKKEAMDQEIAIKIAMMRHKK
jgi:hypothetical protein